MDQNIKHDLVDHSQMLSDLPVPAAQAVVALAAVVLANHPTFFAVSVRVDDCGSDDGHSRQFGSPRHGDGEVGIGKERCLGVAAVTRRLLTAHVTVNQGSVHVHAVLRCVVYCIGPWRQHRVYHSQQPTATNFTTILGQWLNYSGARGGLAYLKDLAAPRETSVFRGFKGPVKGPLKLQDDHPSISVIATCHFKHACWCSGVPPDDFIRRSDT